MTGPGAVFSVKNDQSPGNRTTGPNVSNATWAMIIAAGWPYAIFMEVILPIPNPIHWLNTSQLSLWIPSENNWINLLSSR